MPDSFFINKIEYILSHFLKDNEKYQLGDVVLVSAAAFASLYVAATMKRKPVLGTLPR
jgi:hypothetical protein